MTSYFESLVDFVGAHPQLSFLAVFLLALSEAVPVVGTVVPGSTLILAISALATTAGISPWALFVAAVVGAIAGDGFSFWLGHRYRRQILRGWPLNSFPGLIERSAQLIRKYGITSVFLARFTAVVRAFVPLLAGILRMSSSHFYVANILSALVWALMHVFPGVLVGLAIAFGGAHSPLSLAAVGVLILALIAWSMIKRKTAGVMECPASPHAPDQAAANLPRGPLPGQTTLDSQIVRELVKAPSARGLKSANADHPGEPDSSSDRSPPELSPKLGTEGNSCTAVNGNFTRSGKCTD